MNSEGTTIGLNVQQLQYEYSVLSRTMAKGGSAVELVATSNSPAAAKLAQIRVQAAS